MSNRRRLFFIKDETGVVLSYHATLKSMRREFDAWIKDGIEPDTGHVDYVNTRVGVAALLNALRGD